MDSDYLAWNGERYVWPPPEGWYLASDGRWWAPDTGPDMDLSPLPAESAPTDIGAGYRPEPVDNIDTAGYESPAPQAELTPTQAPYDPGPAPRLFPDSGAVPDLATAQSRAPEPDPTVAHQGDFSAPGAGRPVTGQVAAVSDTDATTAMATDIGDSRRNPTMVMAEPQSTSTGPHPVMSPDPDTGRHDRVQILETAEEAPSAGIQRSRTMPMVAAGLLAAAAIGIAALLALLGGDGDTQTQQPSASAEETEGANSDGLVVSTDDSGTPTSADGAMDDGAMDDGAMGDGDAMGEEGGGSSSTTAVDAGDATENAALIGQFRTLLEGNRITAAALTGDDLMVFGQTACGYATSAGDLPEYQQIRDEALNGAQNDELSIEELQFVVDAAVTVFCPEDATRLELAATAPSGG